MKVKAIIAHYDEQHLLSTNFIELVRKLSSLEIETTVVTTCDDLSNIDAISDVAETVIRPNMGYDFYSYKVGVMNALDEGFEKILFFNSSFFVFDFDLFENTILELIDSLNEKDLVGLTHSNEIEFHLQSYFFGMHARVFHNLWFIDWLNQIGTLSSKQHVIQSYEIGMSRIFVANNAKIKSIFRLNRIQRLATSIRHYLHELRSSKGKFWRLFHKWDNYNPSHFAFEFLLRRHGIVKRELLYINPHRIRTRFVRKLRIRASLIDPKKSHLEISLQPVHWVVDNVKHAHFLRGGMPRVSVVLHLHYPELVSELHSYLTRIPEPFDLYITTSNEGVVSMAIDTFASVANSVHVYVGPNRGRDVSPFLYLLRLGVLDKYQVCLKLHGKRSSYSPKGDFWRQRILSELLSSSVKIEEIIFTLLKGSPGMVGGTKEYVTDIRHWGSNQFRSNHLLKAIGLNPIDTNEIGFFAGTMFWFKPLSFEILRTLDEPELLFEDELGQLDGTLAHAFERIFSQIVSQAGFTIHGTNELNSDILTRSECSIPTL